VIEQISSTTLRQAQRARSKALGDAIRAAVVLPFRLVGAVFGRLVWVLENVTALERDRRDLMSLSAETMKDIGLSPVERQRQLVTLDLRKWDAFWEGVLPKDLIARRRTVARSNRRGWLAG
jgi:uncharacterized protein YjiS (DUF1127 family)